jgi:hypothetical protein
MKTMLMLIAMLVMACGGSPTEPEVDNPYNVQCQMWYDPSVWRVCNLTWNQYDGDDFLAYIVVFEQTSTGWLVTEEPIMDITTTQCYSLPDAYEGHLPDVMYFRILSWDGIVEEVEFSLIQAQ